MRWPAASARPRPGYRGFSVEFGPEVTLEEDLARRDLTINAMARGVRRDAGGSATAESATSTPAFCRHVSDAFVEDPVRVLAAWRASPPASSRLDFEWRPTRWR